MRMGYLMIGLIRLCHELELSLLWNDIKDSYRMHVCLGNIDMCFKDTC